MKAWTDDEKQYLTDKWANTTAEVIGNHLGKTRNAVCGMATKMGLKKSKEFMSTKGKKWTDKQESELRELSKSHTAQQISKIINRSVSSIYTKCSNLGIETKQKPRARIYEKSPKAIAQLGPEITPIQGTVTLRDISDKQCRYVTDTGADMMLCGADVVHGFDYCASCCDVVYQDFGKKRDLNVKPMGRLD